MKKIGIIVGNGKLPLYFLEEAEKQNIEVFPLGLFDTIDDKIKAHKNFIAFIQQSARRTVVRRADAIILVSA